MYSTVTTSCKPDVTTRSTLDWRARWRVGAVISGTDWISLHRQHCEAWAQLRTRAEPFVTGLSTNTAGVAPW